MAVQGMQFGVCHRYLLLKHFKQAHGHFRGSVRYPCPHTDCPGSYTLLKKIKGTPKKRNIDLDE